MMNDTVVNLSSHFKLNAVPHSNLLQSSLTSIKTPSNSRFDQVLNEHKSLAKADDKPNSRFKVADKDEDKSIAAKNDKHESKAEKESRVDSKNKHESNDDFTDKQLNAKNKIPPAKIEAKNSDTKMAAIAEQSGNKLPSKNENNPGVEGESVKPTGENSEFITQNEGQKPKEVSTFDQVVDPVMADTATILPDLQAKLREQNSMLPDNVQPSGIDEEVVFSGVEENKEEVIPSLGGVDVSAVQIADKSATLGTFAPRGLTSESGMAKSAGLNVPTSGSFVLGQEGVQNSASPVTLNNVDGQMSSQYSKLDAKALANNAAQSVSGQMVAPDAQAAKIVSSSTSDLLQQITTGKTAGADKVTDTGINALNVLAAKPLDVSVKDGSGILKGYATSVNVPVGQPGWGEGVTNKVVWLTKHNFQLAEIHLDPPELGPVDIKIKMHQDQASITFNSPHANVRDLLESTLPKLREMLAENGVSLGDVDVSSQQNFQGQSSASNDGAGQSGGATGSQQGNGENQENEAVAQVSSIAMDRVVDFYA